MNITRNGTVHDPKKFDVDIPLRYFRQGSEVPVRDQAIEYYQQHGIRNHSTLKQYISDNTTDMG